MINKIVVVGGGNGTKSIINTIKKIGDFEIIGYTDLTNRGDLIGVRYLGGSEVLSSILADNERCSAVIGGINQENFNERKSTYLMLKELGFFLPVIVSKTAIVNEEVLIGEGTIILEKAMINVSSEIGKCVILDTCAVVEHDCTVGDFVHLSAGSIIGGGVTVAQNTRIGVGAKVIQGIKITSPCEIEAGSIVIKDIHSSGTYSGVPAKLVT